MSDQHKNHKSIRILFKKLQKYKIMCHFINNRFQFSLIEFILKIIKYKSFINRYNFLFKLNN